MAIAFSALLMISCKEQISNQATGMETQTIFSNGQLGPAGNFTGNAWSYGLAANDSIYNTLVGNIYFERSAKSNWHAHPAGRILFITDGVSYHQINGQPWQTNRKGDVVKCPANVLHGHIASPIPDYSSSTLFQIQRKALYTGCSPLQTKNIADQVKNQIYWLKEKYK